MWARVTYGLACIASLVVLVALIMLVGFVPLAVIPIGVLVWLLTGRERLDSY